MATSQIDGFDGQLLTLDQIAVELGRSVRSVRRWIALGSFAPCVRVGNRKVFRRAAVLQWVERNESPSGRQAPRRTRTAR